MSAGSIRHPEHLYSRSTPACNPNPLFLIYMKMCLAGPFNLYYLAYLYSPRTPQETSIAKITRLFWPDRLFHELSSRQ